ncbi:hypothetical protein BC937DRAFT_88813 [Endogone sp. FLAS-F59071]|nr:hypothetical protein BC937DRAFT_88813 [Endogone sp. FLAS-F59071]|eukprot:RUS22485.1 hypothetical protein BC937DRAFT_88813 [Endogone sp. FLAS-F59071]
MSAAVNPSIMDFTIGILVSLGGSIMNALGLNLLKLDHVRNSQLSTRQQRNECSRPMWHLGLYLYIASQLVGSTIALNYLKTQWVAPLGSIALIFNFVFAKMLVGTNITRKDMIGTFVVIASVIWIVVFGGMTKGEDPENDLSLEALKALYLSPLFIVYFSVLNIITFSGLIFSIYSAWVLADEQRKNRDKLFRDMELKRMKKAVGMCMSIVGGLMASETLLLAKSGVKLFVISLSTQISQFTDATSWFIIGALVLTAVLQVYCLNTGLKLYSSVVVVPMFYGTYTAMGLINSMIYLNEIGDYPGWVLILVFVGIAVLIYGVKLLSQTKPEPTTGQPGEAQEMGETSNAGGNTSLKVFAINESLANDQSYANAASSSILDAPRAESRMDTTSELGLVESRDQNWKSVKKWRNNKFLNIFGGTKEKRSFDHTMSSISTVSVTMSATSSISGLPALEPSKPQPALATFTKRSSRTLGPAPNTSFPVAAAEPESDSPVRRRTSKFFGGGSSPEVSTAPVTDVQAGYDVELIALESEDGFRSPRKEKWTHVDLEFEAAEEAGKTLGGNKRDLKGTKRDS